LSSNNVVKWRHQNCDV